MASHWIPHDDFLLRKSIENGASLESLAKGAVKFSRNFTLLELTERWRFLLYNPNVTSPFVFEDPYSSQLLPQTHHQPTTRVRTCYYNARKRMRLEELLNEEDDYDITAIHHEDFNQIAANAFGDNAFDSSDFFDFEFDEFDIDKFHNAFSDMDILQDDHGFDLANDDVMMNQLLNIDNGHIQDVVANTTKHVPLQEEIQGALFQQPNETTSQIHQSDQETWISPKSSSYKHLPTKPVAMSLSGLDPHPEIKNGVIICTLNQEADEIPDNDDFSPHLFKPKLRTRVINSPWKKQRMKPPLPPVRVSSISQARGNNNDNVDLRDYAVTTQANCSSPFKESYTEKATSSFIATTSASLQHVPENEILNMENVTMLEEENNNEIESDEELPSYSDVEAMILDMDLEPVGQDQYEMEATRYRNEEMARKIMRLEQGSKSYMNRNIASHGALALLYGNSRHYIKKAEVLLGRATGEYPVDIDLGRSGSETKVSRRQALIKLKQDGSFEIKNLGKVSIWMNDKEIDHGEVVTLKNNCLLQIRNMSFIFETNEKAIKRYLDGSQK